MLWQVGKRIPVSVHPAKPRMMLYSRSISDEEEQQDAEWKLITHSEVAGGHPSPGYLHIIDRKLLTILSIG